MNICSVQFQKHGTRFCDLNVIYIFLEITIHEKDKCDEIE